MNPRALILSWLREADGPVSGAALAERLGCTRAAVWKHVAALRKSGYEITGRRASGYRLIHAAAPLDVDALAPHLAGTWRTIHWHEVLDSTQRQARELANAGAPEGAVVLAGQQTAGRGRLGRTWHSPPGVNLYLTVLLRPRCEPGRIPPITLVAGLAAADAIREVTGLAPRLKWPNDLQVDGRKVAGILTELQGEADRVDSVLVGIGVNVNLTADAFPPELAATATSLRAALGKPVDRARLAARLLAAMEARYARFRSEGLRGMRGEWEALSALSGAIVEVGGSGPSIRGRVVGIDDEGALVIETSNGARERVVAGEVTLRREVRG